MKYMRLLSRLEGTPLLISENKLRIITEAVTIPLMLGKFEEVSDAPSMSLATQKNIPTSQTVAVIEVFDSLVSKNASAASGMASYEHISAQIDMAVKEGSTNLLFYIDSPGGEVSGLFGLTDKIRGLADKGITTISFTDGMATSAAYAIMAATDTAYATPTSLVGSIAAIMVHMETSKADEIAGRTYSIFRSKEEKALADSKTPLSETAKAKITAMLDSMDTAFNNDVVASRPNLSLQSIIDMKGSEFMAAEALTLGLIDNIVSGLDAVLKTHFSITPSKQKGTKMTLEELQAQLSALQGQMAQMQTDHAVALEAATIAERTRCTALLEAAATLKLPAELALRHINAGYSVDMAKEVMTDIATAKTEASAIDASTGLQSAAAPGSANKTSELRSAYGMATGRKLQVQ